jgi:hypothetical protein
VTEWATQLVKQSDYRELQLVLQSEYLMVLSWEDWKVMMWEWQQVKQKVSCVFRGTVLGLKSVTPMACLSEC